MSIFRDLPNPSGDSADSSPLGGQRASAYGDVFTVQIGRAAHNAADEGTYFTFNTPTPGTGIVDGVVTTYVRTTPSVVIYNGSQRRLVMDFIRFQTTVAPVGGTRVQFTTEVDNINRYTSGGTALTINNVNTDAANSALGVTGYKGVLVAPANSASSRLHAHTIFRWGTIGIIGDVYELVFGADLPMNTNTPVATVSTFSKGVAPLVVGPGGSFVLTQWEAAQSTAPTHEVHGGFFLR